MSGVAMDPAFRYRTLDEVAECFEGVSAPLYRRLWGLLPAEADLPPESETPEPDSDHRVACSMKKHWASFTPAEQEELNRLAKENAR